MCLIVKKSKIKRQIGFIKTSSKKVSHSSKDVYDLIDKFNLKNDNVLKKREKEEDAKIDEIYEKLRIRAKN